MIREKSLKIPEIDGSVLRITPSYLRKSERILRHAPIGMREEAGKFVVAEGSEDMGSIDTEAEKLYATRGDLFWRTNANHYVRYSDDMTIGVNTKASELVAYPDPSGTIRTLVVGSDRTVLLAGTSMKNITESAGTGTCAAVHHERIFLGSGNKLSYSAPLDIEDWSGDTAGSVDLPATGGDILALLSFKERLYVFRERELLRLRADANDLNFRFERVHISCGSLLVGSLQPCGEMFVFATKRGLVASDGSAFRYVPMSRFGAALKEPVQSAYADGKYYTLAVRDSENCILVYDPETDLHHFLEENTDLLAGAGDGVYFRHGTRLCRLTPSGFLRYGLGRGSVEAVLEIENSKGKARRIDAVSVIGKGTYLLTLATENDGCVVELNGSERVILPKALRGTILKFYLDATNELCELCALNLYFREDTP